MISFTSLVSFVVLVLCTLYTLYLVLCARGCCDHRSTLNRSSHLFLFSSFLYHASSSSATHNTHNTDEEEFWYFEVLVLMFKLTLTGLFCIIARNSPFQVILAFFICAIYAMLLLRHTPYLSPSADVLALATSFALALTLLTGYVLSATSAFLKDRPEELKAAVDAMDTFLIVINVIPFVIFLLNIVWRKCCIKKDVKNKEDSAVNKKKKKGNTKIIPVAEEINFTQNNADKIANWNL